jgi:hypothetical protein
MKKQIHHYPLLIILILITAYSTDNQLQAQDDSVHYALPEFAVGRVKMKDGRTEIATMDYNMLTEEMIFEKEGERVCPLRYNNAIPTITYSFTM